MLSEDVPDEPISEVEYDGVATVAEIQDEIDELVVAEQMVYDMRTLSEMLLNEELTAKEYIRRLERLEVVWPERNRFID
jgi:hypothetical protein